MELQTPSVESNKKTIYLDSQKISIALSIIIPALAIGLIIFLSPFSNSSKEEGTLNLYPSSDTDLSILGVQAKKERSNKLFGPTQPKSTPKPTIIPIPTPTQSPTPSPSLTPSPTPQPNQDSLSQSTPTPSPTPSPDPTTTPTPTTSPEPTESPSPNPSS